jgi:hypothetical protein
MNRDHADALVAYARRYAGEAADEATMISVDRLGFKLRLRRGARRSSVRIAFPREVTTAAESREALIEMCAAPAARPPRGRRTNFTPRPSAQEAPRSASRVSQQTGRNSTTTTTSTST